MKDEASPSIDGQRVEAWLGTATKGLCASATERIREEIWDYYRSSVEERITPGRSIDVAADQSVAELGSSRTARRRFRREHLTRTEAATLAGMVEVSAHARLGERRVQIQGWFSLLLVSACFVAGALSPSPWMGLAGFVLAAITGILVLALVMPLRRLDEGLSGSQCLLLNVMIVNLAMLIGAAWTPLVLLSMDPTWAWGSVPLFLIIVGGATCVVLSCLMTVPLMIKLLRDQRGVIVTEAIETLEAWRRDAGYRWFSRI
jgi:hypothetical protein